MGLVIAILLTLAMMGSVLWVMPSPREKRISSMRKVAMASRVRVRLIDKSMAGRLIPWVDNYRGYVSYEVPCEATVGLVSSGYSVVRLTDDAQMHELDRLDELRRKFDRFGLLDGWAESSEALVVSPLGLMLVWKEEGDENTVRETIQRLTDCVDLLKQD